MELKMKSSIFILILISISGTFGQQETKIEKPTNDVGDKTTKIPDPPITTQVPSNVTTTTVAPPNVTTTEKPVPPTTTEVPTNVTTIAPSNVTTTLAPTNITTTQAPTTTQVPSNVTTTEAPSNLTTLAPITTTLAPITTTLPPAVHPCKKFDGPSFIGGIVLAVGLMAISVVAWKFYKARTDRNYHTL